MNPAGLALTFFVGFFAHAAVVSFARGEYRRGWTYVGQAVFYVATLIFIAVRSRP